MKLVFRLFLYISVVAHASLSIAFAKDKSWYTNFAFGVSQLDRQRQSLDQPSSLNPDSQITSFDPGLSLGVSMGRSLTEKWAVELEYRYIDANVDSSRLAGGTILFLPGCPTCPNIPVDPNLQREGGSSDIHAVMVNGLYDLWELSPSKNVYLGIGVGVADISFPGVAGADKGGSEFASQISLGLRQLVNEQLSVRAQIRYFHVNDISYDPFGEGLQNTNRIPADVDELDISATDISVSISRLF